MKRALLLLTFALLLFTAPSALAQEATAIPDDATADTPVIVVTAPAPVETGSVDNDTILIVGVLVLGFIGLGVTVARGGNADRAAANQFNAWQMNREFMEAQERAYQNAGAERRALVDALASITTAVAPLTPAQIDNALARYFKDVQTPGPEPPEPPAAP